MIFPVDVTASEKVISIPITSPTLYVPLALLDEILVIVGGVVSGTAITTGLGLPPSIVPNPLFVSNSKNQNEPV